MTVEEQTQTKKLVVYKKERRKKYQRNQGMRQDITVLHIDRIEHTLDDKMLTKFSYL